jgi:hypothetical protein
VIHVEKRIILLKINTYTFLQKLGGGTDEVEGNLS